MHLLNNKFNTDHFISVTEPLFYFGIDKSKSMTRHLSTHLSSGRIKNYFEYLLIMLKCWKLDYLYIIIIKKSSYYEPATDSLHKNRHRKTN